MTFDIFTLFGLSDSFLTVAIVAGGGFLYREFQRDKWARLDTLADGLESLLLKGWLDWDTLGNPITWFHHALNTAIVSMLGAALGYGTDVRPLLGAFVFACGMVVFYVIRERVSAQEERLQGILWLGPHFTRAHPHTSYIVDHLGDVAGPVLYTLWLWSRL